MKNFIKLPDAQYGDTYLDIDSISAVRFDSIGGAHVSSGTDSFAFSEPGHVAAIRTLVDNSEKREGNVAASTVRRVIERCKVPPT